MNEQDKRDLMLRFAVENKGEWPEGFRTDNLVLVSGEIEATNMAKHWVDKCDKMEWIGTKQEYLAFIDSLFDGAPDRATHVDSENASCFYRNDGHAFYSCEKPFGVRCAKFDKLIPRPRKQEVEQVEWMPEVGEECEVYGGVYGSDDMRWMKSEVMNVKDGEVLAESTSHSGTYVFYARGMFRPLKTEVEKEREAFIEAGIKVNKSLRIGATEREMFEALIDAGWRPNDQSL